MKKDIINYSFIIPHHNTPELLERCINTIPQRKDIEIIVVDDNSDIDKKPYCIRENLKVIYISKEETKGAGYARNVGINNAIGKWLLFPDSDDYYIDSFIDILDKYVNNDIDVLYFNFIFKDGETGKLLSVGRSKELNELIANFKKNEYNETVIKYRNYSPWNKMIKREFVIKNGFYYECSPNGNDMLFSLLIGFHLKKYEVEPSIIYVYLKNKNSIVNSRKNYLQNYCFLKHTIQANYFHNKIGYSELKTSFILTYLRIIKYSSLTEAIKTTFYIIINIVNLYKSRVSWYNITVKNNV